jgi:hypothetical protein
MRSNQPSGAVATAGLMVPRRLHRIMLVLALVATLTRQVAGRAAPPSHKGIR